MQTAKNRAMETFMSQDSNNGLVKIASVTPLQDWIPSRFNARSAVPDGTLVLYNSYTGAFSGFPASAREQVEAMLHKTGFRARLEGLTKYLYERGFIVEKGTDEFQRLRLLYGTMQYRHDRLDLILLSSEECNFRCVYCYETFPRGTMEPWVREAIIKLTENRIRSLNAMTVSYFGGEPLLGLEAIDELAPSIKGLCDEHNVPFGSGMTTNGYLLTPDVFERLLSWKINSYQITLDGIAEDHDSHRILKGGGPTFSRILENLRAMRRLPDEFQVSLRINFDQTNLPRIPEFLDTIKDLSEDKRFVLRFYPIGKWGGPNDATLETCGLTSEEERQRLDVMAADSGFNPESRMPYLTARTGNSVCYAARPYNLIIGADGKIMKCTIVLDTKDYNIVGRITEDGRAELQVDKFAKWVAPYFEDDPVCKKCFYVPVCQGSSCPLPRIVSGERPCPDEKLQIRKTLTSIWQVKNRAANLYNITKGELQRHEPAQ